MTPSEKARVQECVKELSEILDRNTPSDKCQSLEDIEKEVRKHLLESVVPDLGFVLVRERRESFRAFPSSGFPSGVVYPFIPEGCEWGHRFLIEQKTQTRIGKERAIKS